MQDQFSMLLKTARKEAKITQKQLAQILGVATGTVQQWELGVRFPRVEMLKKIEDTLKIALVPCDVEKSGMYSSLRSENIDKAMQAMQQATLPEYNIENDFPVYLPDLSPDEYKLFNEVAENFEKLNAEGMKEAAKRIEELTQIPKYQRSETLSEDGEYTDTLKQEKPPESLEKPLDGK